MKANAKRIISLILVAVVAVTTLVALTACDNSEMNALPKKVQELQDKVADYEETDAEKTITVIVGDKSTTLTTRENRMVFALSELVEKGNISAFKYTSGSYGAFITELDAFAPQGNQYISVYHTIDNDAYKQQSGTWNPDGSFTATGGFDTKDYNGATYYYSSVGISTLPVIDGATYLFLLESF